MLDHKKRYLQVAFNNTLEDASRIIYSLPQTDRILIEAGTPLIKNYGSEAIRFLYRNWSLRLSGTSYLPYIVADLKTMDRGETEVKTAQNAGASAAVALGQSPLETLNVFIKSCKESGLDSMIDMMNVDQPVKILRKLKTIPKVVILHRGVDEEIFNPDKPIPYLQINKVLAGFNVIISIAGGDTIREVQRAVFNGANIVVVWKNFYEYSSDIGELAESFLREIK